MPDPQKQNSAPEVPCDDCVARNLLYLRVRNAMLGVTTGAILAASVIYGINRMLKEPMSAAALPEQNSSHTNIKNAASLPGSTEDCSGANASTIKCLMQNDSNTQATEIVDLEDSDLQMANIAWKYFENNYNPETGLVNSVNNYPSTTMWDTGSSLSAYVSARDLGIIDEKQFDDAIMALLDTLSSIELFDGAAPNKVYHTKTRKMVNYGNEEVENGIGVSVLDLARLVSWMNTLQCIHPKYHIPVNKALSRWDYTRLIKNDEMYGMARDNVDNNQILSLQEGRLGYEQYAGKIFKNFGFNVDTASTYNNRHRSNTNILGVNIAFDSRDPRQFTANNYVVTESYVMDAMELGIDDENRDLLRNIFEVQKKRWQQTNIVTAISEDNIDREPYFIYNTIFNAGLNFTTISDTGEVFDHLKSVSTKAAISMAMLFPDDPYSEVLLSTVKNAYDPNGGWYSGIYESGEGYNDAMTANTNGVILGGLLFKKYGPLSAYCNSNAKPLNIASI